MKASPHAPPHEPILEIAGLRFGYPAVDGEPPFRIHLDRLELHRGERIAFHGPSGCGKSTLLDLIAGISVPSAGSLRVAGADLRALDEAGRRAHRIRRLGFVFQDFPLVEYLDALDNVLLPFRLTRTLCLDDVARRRALRLLDELGLASRTTRRPAELSQGERQRLAIARSLVTEPALLLADEPTAGLDPDRSLAVLELLENLCRDHGSALILVTHDPLVLGRFEHRLDVEACSIHEAG